MNHQRIKVLFILPSLRRGGAERVVAYLAQYLDRESFDTYLLVLYKPTRRDYSIREDIPVHYFCKKRSFSAIPSIVCKIIKLKPDIVFTSIGQLNLLGGILSLIFRRTKFVAREASVFSAIDRFARKENRKLFLLKKVCYNYLNKIVCQSEDMADDLEENLDIPKKKIVIIGNPVTIDYERDEIKKNNTIPQLITVGRLSREKGIDRLLVILSQLNFDFHYILIGDGNEKGSILKMIRTLSLADKVTYIPYCDDVSKYLAISDLFLQGSYVEGFPNALAESCAVGVPGIAFNAVGGTKEIIEDGVNGFIVHDSSEFKKKLIKGLFECRWDHRRIQHSVAKNFAPDIILSKYEALFKSVI